MAKLVHSHLIIVIIFKKQNKKNIAAMLVQDSCAIGAMGFLVTNNTNNTYLPMCLPPPPLADIPMPNQTLLVGRNLSYTCNYSGDPVGVKYICMGDLHECRYVLNTSQQQEAKSRYDISNEAEKETLTITIRKLESKDTGKYWCYTMRNKTRIIHNKFTLTVVASQSELPGEIFSQLAELGT